MTRKRVSKEEKQQRHEWAMKQIDKDVGFSRLASFVAETNRRLVEIMECKRLECWQSKAGSQPLLEALNGDHIGCELSSVSPITFCCITQCSFVNSSGRHH